MHLLLSRCPTQTIVPLSDYQHAECTSGEQVDDLKGGVAGGSILCGVLRKNAEIEIRPGIVKKDQEGKVLSRS